MSIYFVRHGQTEWNRLGKLQGNTDIELNEMGRNQALLTATKLQSIQIDKIYCSPLTRAQETASIINQNWGLDIQVEERLRERNFGSYEGNYSQNLDYQMLWKLSETPPFQGAEDTISFYKRVEDFLDSIVEQAIDSNLLIVAHGGVSIPYYCYFHGFDFEDLSTLLLGNCEVSCIDSKICNLRLRG